MGKYFSFYDVFSRKPSYKERDQFASKTRDELIDALVAANETVVTNAETASDRYDDMVESYEKKIAKTAEDTKLANANTARATQMAAEDTDRKHAQVVADLKAAHKAELAVLNQEHELEVESLTASNEIAIERAELDIEFAGEKKVKDAEERAQTAEKVSAVALSQVEIYKGLVDLNGDILDIKDITTQIITKLPTINLSSLPSPAAPVKEKEQKKD